MIRTFYLFKLCLILVFTACSSEAPKLVRLKDKTNIKEEGNPPKFKVIGGTVDILFVIDDSGSMADHQKNLATNIGLLIQGLNLTTTKNYQYGVITTDMSDAAKKGKLQGSNYLYINNQTPNGLAELQANLDVGTNGHWDEETFSPVQAALTPPLVDGYNKGFYREDAYLVLVILTDTSDHSWISTQEMYNFLIKLKGGDASKILIYAALNDLNDINCEGEYTDPIKIKELIRLFGGIEFSLCDPAFGSQLAKIGEEIGAKTLAAFITLDKTPQLDTIRVWFGEQFIPPDKEEGWTYVPDRNGLNFGLNLKLNLKQTPQPSFRVEFEPAKVGSI